MLRRVDEVFRALANPHRRALLDRLHGRPMQTLRSLCEGAGMTRFGVMKHLQVLEAAGLVLVRLAGREKLHTLNPVPIRQLHDRWVSRFTGAFAGALLQLKEELEHPPMTDATAQIYELFIRTTPERLWQALTDPAFTTRFFFGTAVRSSLRPGEPIDYSFPDGSPAVTGEVVEADPPRRLVHTWTIRYDPSLAHETSRVTWEIEPRGNACKLTATHELAGAPGTATSVRGGWPLVLSGLKTLLETGEPLEVASAAA
jgi:uncharacterized protein YndB with AHSA1/START domain/DNA-binding transcriptional ArsR family regulator